MSIPSILNQPPISPPTSPSDGQSRSAESRSGNSGFDIPEVRTSDAEVISKAVLSIFRLMEELMYLFKKIEHFSKDLVIRTSANTYGTAIEAALAEHRATWEQGIAGIIGNSVGLVLGLAPAVLGGARALLTTLRKDPETATVLVNQRGPQSSFRDEDTGSIAGDSTRGSANRSPVQAVARSETDAIDPVDAHQKRLEDWIKRLEKFKQQAETLGFSATLVVPQLTSSAASVAAADDTLKQKTLEALLEVFRQFIEEENSELSNNSSGYRNLLGSYSNL